MVGFLDGLYTARVQQESSSLSLLNSAFSGQTFLWVAGKDPVMDHDYTEVSAGSFNTMNITLNSEQSPTGSPEVVWIVQESAREYSIHSTAKALAQPEMAYQRFMVGLDVDKEFSSFLDHIGAKTDIQSPQITLVIDPPLDCLIQFLCSPQMSMDRIHVLATRLRELYGETISVEGEDYHAFPTSSDLESVTESELREEGFGYRSEYITRTSEQVIQGDPSLPSFGDEGVRKTLMEYYGVGDKVADCVLAYGYSDMSAIPIDTWMKSLAEAVTSQPDTLSTYEDYQSVLKSTFRDGREALDQLFAYELLTSDTQFLSDAQLGQSKKM